MVTSPDFLAIGHVTKDLLSGGGYVVGGTATYAALTAHGLGLSVAVLTSAPPDLDLSHLMRGIDLHVVPSPVATTFENIYEGQRRYQFVHGVTPQGWMRQWNSNGRVMSKPWLDAERILSSVDVLVFSEEDVGGDQTLIQRYTEMARIAVVTRGRSGARVFWEGSARDFSAFRAREVDPTGAGDVFAAAFLVRLKETGVLYQAATFANCTASFAIEGSGTASIPSRQQVEERLRCGELYE